MVGTARADDRAWRSATGERLLFFVVTIESAEVCHYVCHQAKLQGCASRERKSKRVVCAVGEEEAESIYQINQLIGKWRLRVTFFF